MMDWCRKHNVGYADGNQYNGITGYALKHRRPLTHNGVVYYATDLTYSIRRDGGKIHAYLIWEGQSLDVIAEAAAYILMACNTEMIWVFRCREASQATLLEENHRSKLGLLKS